MDGGSEWKLEGNSNQSANVDMKVNRLSNSIFRTHLTSSLSIAIRLIRFFLGLVYSSILFNLLELY